MPVGSEKILKMAASNTGNPPENVEVLVVGGGGNGSAGPGSWGGAGGGAGGFRTSASHAVTAGSDTA